MTDRTNELPDADPALLAAIEQANKAAADQAAAMEKAAAATTNAIIVQVGGGRLHINVAACEGAVAATEEVFQRGGQLVQVIRRPAWTAGGGQRHSSASILAYDMASMRVLMNALVRFERWDARAFKYFPCDCPPDLTAALLAADGHWPNIRPLLNIVTTPTLRADGSILQEPGYDQQTGLFVDLGDTAFPPVPDHPTKKECRRALKVVQKLLKGFPFKDSASASVALALYLTVLVRQSMRSSPLFAIDAPTMGSGKTLLVTGAGLVATGENPAMKAQQKDVESERKMILSALVAGGPLQLIDNVGSTLASDALCSVLSEPLFTDRLLGQSKMLTVPTSTVWAVTGNNLAIAADLASRALICTLDSGLEHPEERTFPGDFRLDLLKARPELVVALLTIMRGYFAAGQPKQHVNTFGRFEQWQAFGRSPLLWLGQADPCASRQNVEDRDPIRERLGNLASAWFARFGSTETTVAVALRGADAPLRTAMMEVAAEGESINGRKLGWYLTRFAGRIIRGLKFERGTSGRDGLGWRVMPASESEEGAADPDGSSNPAGSAGSRVSSPSDSSNCQTMGNDSSMKGVRRKPANPQNPQSGSDSDSWDIVL